jgi:hypothetical protein
MSELTHRSGYTALTTRKRLLSGGILCVMVAAAVLLRCSDDYNPFTDERNARAYIEASFSEGDTIDLFSTETLTVQLAVGELIDTFSLHSGANRYFSDTVVARGSREWPSGGTVNFMVSFYDTGRQEISCVTKRRGGEEVVKRRSCYVRSPLRQEPVIDTLGVNVHLVTEPVRDRDVVYFWSFGGGVVVQSVPCSTQQKVPVNAVSTVGQLWVGELNGSHTSPRTPFVYSVYDQEGPEITCINEGTVGKDTVFTASSVFYLNMQIIDGSGGRIFNPTVNGEPFDVIRDDLYLKMISSPDLLTKPELLTVRAYDPFSNLAEKRIWAVYDPDAEGGFSALITFEVPSQNELVVAKKDWRFSGTVEVADVDSFSLAVEYRINGKTVSPRENIKGMYSAQWIFSAEVGEGGNTITVLAYDSSETVVAEASRVLIYDSEMADPVPPVIAGLQIDGKTISGKVVTVAKNSVRLGVIAFDRQSEIEQVFFNTQVVPPAADGSGYLWETEVPALHSAEGNRVVISVSNTGELSQNDTVVIRQNLEPEIKRYPKPPLPLQVETVYTDTIIAVDPEGDPVRYKKSSGPQSLRIDSVSGKISWIPKSVDTGRDTIAITIQDPYGALLYSYPIVITNSSDVPEPVQFTTTVEDFPVVLEVGRDTMRVPLVLMSGTGKKPVSFSVTADRQTETPVTIDSDVVYWVPQAADTGRYVLTVTAIDSFESSTLLYPQILVVPPNRAFTISSLWTGDTTLSGALDMFGREQPETLVVTVHDPDTGMTDTISALLTVDGTVTSVPVAGRTVTIPIASRTDATGIVTMRLVITDRAGHTEETLFTIYYGASPSTPQLLLPVTDSIIRDSIATFLWTITDPDGTPLRNTLFLATGDTVLSSVKTVDGKNTVTVEGLTRAGRYFWQIHSTDGVTESVSRVDSFFIDPPLRLRLATGSEEIPSWLDAGEDTMMLSLRLADGTGQPPFSVTVDGVPLSTVTIDSMNIRWMPQDADTGIYRIVVAVRDAIGNGDSIRQVVRVLPANRPPELMLNHALQMTASGALDLSSESAPVSLVYSVEDADSAHMEQYTFHSVLRHTERVEDRGSAGIYTVTIDPKQHLEQWFDTLTVWVKNRRGLTDTVTVELFYGYWPVRPRNPDPADGITHVNPLVILRWSPPSPEPGLFSYTVSMGTSPADMLPIGAAVDTFLTVGTLMNARWYYWKVAMTDGVDTVEGPVWRFYQLTADAVVTLNTSASGVPLNVDLTDVPVALRLNTSTVPDLNGSLFAEPGSFTFTNSAGGVLSYEIEQWNRLLREMVVWVLVDTLLGNRSDQTIAIDYDPNGSNNSSDVAVFGSYEGVWHMEQTTGGFPAATYTVDASGNNRDGTYTGFGITIAADGIAGDAASINDNQYIAVANSQSIYMDEPMTIEAWVQLPTIGMSLDQVQPLVAKGDEPPFLELDNNNRWFRFGIGAPLQSDRKYCTADETFQQGQWYHLSGRFDGTSLTFFVNGVPQDSSIAVTSVPASTEPLQIGHNSDQPLRGFRGNIDEVRISTVARTDDWIRASYEGAHPGTRLYSIERIQ